MSTDRQPSAERKPVTLSTLARMKRGGEKFAVLTAYDATFAGLLEEAGVEVLLVGDSLGMVVQGRHTTIPVTLDDMVYHARLVARGSRLPLRMVDMPFLSYATSDAAFAAACRLMQEGAAQVLKLEVNASHAEVVRALARNGVPVCAHLGLLPQTVHKMGGYKVQGRSQAEADTIVDAALRMQDAGADVVLVECIVADLGARLAAELEIPVIGIGAGPDCDGQVLVLQDIIGITRGHTPKFSHNFLTGRDSVLAAAQAYVRAVKERTFPAPEHCF